MWDNTPPNLPGYVFSACNRGRSRRPSSHAIGSVSISHQNLALWVIQTWDGNRLSELANELGAALPTKPPEAVFNSLNAAVCHANDNRNGHECVCSCVMVFDRSDHTVAFTAEGLDGPEVRLPDNRIILSESSTTGLPLGLLSSFVYETNVVKVKPMSSVIWISPYTSQIMNPSGMLYGFRGLCKQVQAAPMEPGTMVEYFVNDIDNLIGDGRHTDDICIICARRIE